MQIRENFARLGDFDHSSPFARLIRLPLRLIPKATQVSIRSGPAKGLKWIVGSSIHGCWLGTYELDKQTALRRFVKPGMTVYDIGAQAGFYTLFFSRLVGDKGRVYAFEPCAFEMRNLIEHIRINVLANVHAVQAAVGKMNGLTPFSVDRGTCQNALTTNSFLEVSTVRLDDNQFPGPDVIKMDVEGGESEVLLGSRELITKHRPVLFVALHGRAQHERCAEILAAYNYQLFDLSGRPISGIPDTDEIFAQPVDPH